MYSHPAASPIGTMMSGIMMNHASEDPLGHPMVVAGRMGLAELTPGTLRSAGKNAFIGALSKPRPLCLRPKWCAALMWHAMDHIDEVYGGDPERIWNRGLGIRTGQLVRRLGRVPGIGDMAYALADVFARCWSLPLLECGQDKLELDRHQQRVSERLGWHGDVPSVSLRTRVATHRGLKHVSLLCCWEAQPDCGACPIKLACPSMEKHT